MRHPSHVSAMHNTLAPSMDKSAFMGGFGIRLGDCPPVHQSQGVQGLFRLWILKWPRKHFQPLSAVSGPLEKSLPNLIRLQILKGPCNGCQAPHSCSLPAVLGVQEPRARHSCWQPQRSWKDPILSSSPLLAAGCRQSWGAQWESLLSVPWEILKGPCSQLQSGSRPADTGTQQEALPFTLQTS